MSSVHHAAATEFLGLAPFLRKSIHNVDLQPLAQEWIALAEANSDDANLWMNLATLMLCLGARELGLDIQAQALAMQQRFSMPAAQQPARLRVLLLMAPGDLAANMPLDCLLEDSDIDLEYYFVLPFEALEKALLPDHDLVILGMSDSDDNRPILEAITPVLKDWPRPLLNRPSAVANTERERASQLLQGVPGLIMPPTLAVMRDALQRIAAEDTPITAACEGMNFPVIVRPRDSHGGHGLARLDDPEMLAGYLAGIDGEHFTISPFIDYRNEDGLYAKYRVVLVDGVPFASHMAISEHWMIHYVNAGMYEDSAKRAQEAAWMASFDDFAARHQPALNAIYERTALDYVCIDCAQTRDGQLLVFEVDHAMVVHAMDSAELFPHKQEHMAKAKTALRNFLLRRAETEDARTTGEPA
jgi:glutathione synthase/RimK-type ligase-like ATP-grasp enzyme